MKLIVDNIRTVITDLTTQERNELKQILQKKDVRTGFVRGKFDASKVKTEKFYFENKAGILFFTGLLRYMLPFFKKYDFTLENKTTRFSYMDVEYTKEELRKYFNPKFEHVEHQIYALQAMLGQYRGTIKAPTSSGKTEIIIVFCKLTELKTLIIAPKVDLAKQLQERFNKAGLNAGLMTGASKKYNGEHICIATPQMALALSDREFECVICDECHHCSSKTYQDFFKATKAKVIFGFSATPDTNEVDWLKIQQFCGPIIAEIKTKELLDNGVITYPEISFVPISQYNTSDWDSARENCIMYNKDRNNKIKELCENSPKPVLVLIRNIEHGDELSKVISDSIFLSGRDDNETREKVLKDFEDKKLDVLVGSIGVLSEGISINSIRTLIYAAGGKSDVITTQALGRALRRDEGKDKAIVYDFFDIGNKYTEKHSLQRAKIYKDVGFPVNLNKPQ